MNVLEELAERVTDRSVVLFLGGVDVGKTTLIRQLHERVGGEVVDADIGQSEIGLPGVVSLGTYRGGPRAGYFVGDISPRGNFLQVLAGVQKMVSKASRPCLIDTDGYIDEDAARAYKSELVNIIEPELLVLVQRQRELDYFKLYARKGIPVIELPVSHGGSKSREERIRARETAFRNYFTGARIHKWSLEELKFERALLGHGEALDVVTLSRLLGCPVLAGWKVGRRAIIVVSGFARAGAAVNLLSGIDEIRLVQNSDVRGLLVACLEEGELHGLGILKSISNENVEIFTPAERATILQAGSLQVREDGTHTRLRLTAYSDGIK